MKLITYFIFLVLVLISCSNSDSSKVDKSHLQKSLKLSDSISEVAVWADEYILRYLDANQERFTEIEGYPITYIKYTKIRDKKIFAAAQIGHNFKQRFVTEQWIYIDSTTKKVFELHTPIDSLILWTTL